MKGKSYSVPVGMMFKKYYCSCCGSKLEKSRTHRVVTKDDIDYYQYHEYGNYPRYDYDIYSYDFVCKSCNKHISYYDQCIIEKIQKKYRKKILNLSEINENYYLEQQEELKRILKRNIIIPSILVTVAFILIYIFSIEKTELETLIYFIIYLLIMIYVIYSTIKSHKGKYKIKYKRGYSQEQIMLLEKLHTYCTSNKDLIEESNLCYCFYCKRKMKKEDVKEYVDTNKTAICPFCGIDSIIPDCIEEQLNDEVIEDMNKYWF